MIRKIIVDDNYIVEENSDAWKDELIMSNIFAGDDGDYSILTDKIVVARKSNKLCDWCYGKTIPGTLVRVTSIAFDGTIHSYRYCHECCHALLQESLSCDANGYNCEHPDRDDDLEFPHENRLQIYKKDVA